MGNKGDVNILFIGLCIVCMNGQQCVSTVAEANSTVRKISVVICNEGGPT